MHRQKTSSKAGLIWTIVILAVILVAGGLWFGLNRQAQVRAQEASSVSRSKARSVAESRSAAKAS